MDSLENNFAISEFIQDISKLQKMKDELNKLFSEGYNKINHDYGLSDMLHTMHEIAVCLDNKLMVDYLNEIHQIMSLLFAYYQTDRLSYVPCPIIFSHIGKNLAEVLTILQDYKDNVKDSIELEQPYFFSFPEEGVVDRTYTINLSPFCDRVAEVLANLKELAKETAAQANKITASCRGEEPNGFP